MNLYILDPSNLSDKYKLEHELQKIYYSQFDKSIIKINYIPSKYPQYKFFNKFLSIIDYFQDKKIEKGIYCDHDVFIKDLNILKIKFYLKYSHINFYNWEEKFKKYLNLNFKSNINERYSTCLINLSNDFISLLKRNIDNFITKFGDKILSHSGDFEEYFYTKTIKNLNYKPILFKTNDYFQKIFVMHYQINNRFIFNLLKLNKNSKNIIQKLQDIYKDTNEKNK